MPTVSVIVPNYNHAAYLHERIESILGQTFTDFEVILLDDCSTDNSVEILKHYQSHPKVSHLMLNRSNSGSTFKQWQKGFDLAKGEYIWIAESDDHANSAFLSRSVELLDSNPDVVLAFCQSYIINEKGTVIGSDLERINDLHTSRWLHNYINDGISEIKNYLTYKNIIPNASAVVFRKSHAINFLSECLTYRCCGDWYLWMRMLMHGRIAYIAEHLNYYRLHERTVRKDVFYSALKLTEYLRVLSVIFRHVDIEQICVDRNIKRIIKEWIISMYDDKYHISLNEHLHIYRRLVHISSANHFHLHRYLWKNFGKLRQVALTVRET